MNESTQLIAKTKTKESMAIIDILPMKAEEKIAILSLCLGVAHSITEVMRAVNMSYKEFDTVVKIIRVYSDGLEEIARLGENINVINDTSKE